MAETRQARIEEDLIGQAEGNLGSSAGRKAAADLQATASFPMMMRRRVSRRRQQNNNLIGRLAPLPFLSLRPFSRPLWQDLPTYSIAVVRI